MDIAVKLLVLALVVPTTAAVFVYLFLFKTMAHMQSRLGPMNVGPHGSLQIVAEGIKWLQKEDLFPARADRLVFGLAPVLTLVAAFGLYVVIPVGPGMIVADLDTGILFALAVTGIGTLAVLMAGWGSASKYSLLGGLRAAAQLLAYEIPLVLAVIGVVIQSGSLSMLTIVGAQEAGLWFVIPQIVGFVIFLIAAQAELTQTPFDIPVAESELVAGHLTEYSGFRFLLFFLSELATAAALSGLAVTLFLGGWHIPFVSLDGTAAEIVGPVVVAAKVIAVGFLIFWVRFSFPRLREEQLQNFAWKVLIPLTLLNLAATAVFKVAF